MAIRAPRSMISPPKDQIPASRRDYAKALQPAETPVKPTLGVASNLMEATPPPPRGRKPWSSKSI